MNNKENKSFVSVIRIILSLIPFLEIPCLLIGVVDNIKNSNEKVSRLSVYANVICVVKLIFYGLFLGGMKLIDQYAPDEFFCTFVEPSKCSEVDGKYVCNYENSHGYKRDLVCNEIYEVNEDEGEYQISNINESILLNEEKYAVNVNIVDYTLLCMENVYSFDININGELIDSFVVKLGGESYIDFYANNGFITNDDENIIFNFSDPFKYMDSENVCSDDNMYENSIVKYNVTSGKLNIEKSV